MAIMFPEFLSNAAKSCNNNDGVSDFFNVSIVNKLKPVYLTTLLNKNGNIKKEVEFTDYLTKQKIRLNHDNFIGNLLEEAFSVKTLFANYCYFFAKGKRGLEYLDYFYKYFLGEYKMSKREFFFVYKKFKEAVYDTETFDILNIGNELKKYFSSLTHSGKCGEVHRFLTAELIVRSLALREIEEFDF